MTARANLYSSKAELLPWTILQSMGVGATTSDPGAGGTAQPVVLQLGEARIELAQMPAAERAAHLEALHDYLSNRCALEDPALPAKLEETRSAVTVTIDPGLDAAGRCARFVRAVAARTGALVLMDDGTVEDAEGRTVAYPAAEEENPLAFGRTVEPPPGDRVARRALVLAALAWRGQLEAARTPVAVAQLAVWKAWVEKHGLVEELDEAERALLAAPYGTLTERQLIHCGWGIEGAAVLAWALGLLELPPHDTKVSPADLASAVGLFAAAPPSLTAELRPRAELAAMTARLFGVAWRLLRFTSAPGPFDFVSFSEGAWFGGFDLDGVPVLEGDLALGGAPISKAPAAAADEAASIAVERFRAARWLDGRQAAWREEVPALSGGQARPGAAEAAIPDAGTAASATGACAPSDGPPQRE